MERRLELENHGFATNIVKLGSDKIIMDAKSRGDILKGNRKFSLMFLFTDCLLVVGRKNNNSNHKMEKSDDT